MNYFKSIFLFFFSFLCYSQINKNFTLATNDYITFSDFKANSILHDDESNTDYFFSNKENVIKNVEIINGIPTQNILKLDPLENVSKAIKTGKDIYFLNYKKGTLNKYNLETKSNKVLISGMLFPINLILDNNKIIISEMGAGKILSYDILSEEKTTLLSNLGMPYGLLKVDSELLFTEFSSGKVSILSSQNTVNEIFKDLNGPTFLTKIAEKIYLSETNASRILSIYKDLNNENKWLYNISVNNNITKPTNIEPSNDGKSLLVCQLGLNTIKELRLNEPPTGQLIVNGNPKLFNKLKMDYSKIKDLDGIENMNFTWKTSSDSISWKEIDKNSLNNNLEFEIKDKSLVNNYIKVFGDYIDGKGVKEFVESNSYKIQNYNSPFAKLKVFKEGIIKINKPVYFKINDIKIDEDATIKSINYYIDNKLVASTNNTNKLIKVEFKNTNLNHITNSVKIKFILVDSNNQSFEESKTLFFLNNKVSVINPIKEVYLFPNPANSIVNLVNENAPQKPYSYKIYNTYGSVVLEGEQIDEKIYSIDVSSIKEGIYHLNSTDGNQIKNLKLIIKR